MLRARSLQHEMRMAHPAIAIPRREARPLAKAQPSRLAVKCRRKFLRHFPDGFTDETYLSWERDYKVAAHDRFRATLGRSEMRALLRAREYEEIASRAIRLESRTNLLFSFEKMALRDAVKMP